MGFFDGASWFALKWMSWQAFVFIYLLACLLTLHTRSSGWAGLLCTVGGILPQYWQDEGGGGHRGPDARQGWRAAGLSRRCPRRCALPGGSTRLPGTAAARLLSTSTGTSTLSLIIVFFGPRTRKKLFSINVHTFKILILYVQEVLTHFI